MMITSSTPMLESIERGIFQALRILNKNKTTLAFINKKSYNTVLISKTLIYLIIMTITTFIPLIVSSPTNIIYTPTTTTSEKIGLTLGHSLMTGAIGAGIQGVSNFFTNSKLSSLHAGIFSAVYVPANNFVHSLSSRISGLFSSSPSASTSSPSWLEKLTPPKPILNIASSVSKIALSTVLAAAATNVCGADLNLVDTAAHAILLPAIGMAVNETVKWLKDSDLPLLKKIQSSTMNLFTSTASTALLSYFLSGGISVPNLTFGIVVKTISSDIFSSPPSMQSSIASAVNGLFSLGMATQAASLVDNTVDHFNLFLLPAAKCIALPLALKCLTPSLQKMALEQQRLQAQQALEQQNEEAVEQINEDNDVTDYSELDDDVHSSDNNLEETTPHLA